MTVDVEKLYRSYGPLVLRRCRRLLRDEQKALDAMQDVFVELLRRRSRLEDTAISSLCLLTATNVCLNRLRSERRHPEDRDEALLLAIAGEEHEPEERALSQRIVARLFYEVPSSTRVMAVLHYVDGLTLQEVASELGLSVSGVRKRLRVLKARLRLPIEGESSAGNQENRDG